jgi:glycosidase
MNSIGSSSQQPVDHQSVHDRARETVYAERERDWRCGAIVYQVLVDRFAPSADLNAKRHLYAPPRTLHGWDEPARAGRRLASVGVWSHELAFWGGDLPSLRSRLDYIAGLGVDVLYLNPIHLAMTNHKYDAWDFHAVSPEYGKREDLRELAKDLHARGMKLMLDGVFNHMGRGSPYFLSARSSPQSPWRGHFFIGSAYRLGYRAWYNVPNLPELNLENPRVRELLYEGPDSVVQSYLRDGVDGWRLDVAYDLGMGVLAALTESAHRAKPGSWVVGEVWNYPEEWIPALDGVMNFHAREIILKLVHGRIGPRQASDLLERMIEDAGVEGMLRSWILLDNHDVARIRTEIPHEKQRRLAQVLQFTLPGSVCLYYGSELGMEGAKDPEIRSPMRWDLHKNSNTELSWIRQLIQFRREHRALRVGDYRRLDSQELLAFTRRTNRWSESVFVLANPSSKSVRETLSVRESKIMSNGVLVNLLDRTEVKVHAGLIDVDLPAYGVLLLVPAQPTGADYSFYKRVH